MKCFSITILVLLLHGVALGNFKHHYKGDLLISGKKISFELDYSIQKNNLITGTSLTAKGTSDETKCKIRGRYNRKTSEIYFYETVVIRSKSTLENLNFCLLSARLKRKESKTAIIYSGHLTGTIRGSKKKCARGTIRIETPKKKKSPTPKKITEKPKKKEISVDKLFSHVNSKKVARYSLNSKTATLSIWDDANEDGDRVSIYLNGKLILDNYELRRTKKQIRLSLATQAKKSFLKIKALNEGKASPNTSRIRISSNDTQKEIKAYIKTSESIFIELSR